MSEFSKKKLLKFLDDWTYLRRFSIINLPDWWGRKEDKKAYQQIKEMIEKGD